MKNSSKTQWILFFALVATWILMIQVVPRFLPFNFGRVNVAGISIHTDYLTHLLLFVVVVLAAGYLRLGVKLRYMLPLMIVAATVAEVVQIYIPKRTFNYWDLVANIAGVVIGVGVLWVVQWNKKDKAENSKI